MAQKPEKGAGFIGKWIMDPKKTTNFDAFMKASGITDETMLDKFRDAGGYAEFIYKGGNEWNCKYKTDIEKTEQNIDFTPGKEVATEFDKMKLKFTMTFEEENKMTEIQELEIANGSIVKITREVNGDVINAKHEVNGVIMSTVMNREKK